jgi:ABC-type sugar transport system ATPase subunit
MNEQANVVELKAVSKEFAQGQVRALEDIDHEIRPRAVSNTHMTLPTKRIL